MNGTEWIYAARDYSYAGPQYINRRTKSENGRERTREGDIQGAKEKMKERIYGALSIKRLSMEAEALD